MFPTVDQALLHLRISFGPEDDQAWRAAITERVSMVLADACSYVQEHCERRMFNDAAELDAAVQDGTAGPCPMVITHPIRRAVLLLVGHWYVVGEAVNVGNIVSEVPLGVERLLRKHRRGFGV